jgi:hypothetical protein
VAFTRLQLINRALSLVGALGAGQSANAEDVALTGAAADAIVEYLHERGIAEVNLAEDKIDNAVFHALARRVALEIGPEYGVGGPSVDVLADSDNEIRRIYWSYPVTPVLRTDYL